MLLAEVGNHEKLSCVPYDDEMQTVLQRAIELAPECSTMGELRKRLKAEGFESLDAHIFGLGTKRQLRGLFNHGKGVRNNWNRAG